MALRPPTKDEIVQILRTHPLIKLRERVKRAFLVGSQTGGYDHKPNTESDVDILLEVAPKAGYTAQQLEEKYRRLLQQHFVTHGIRGEADHAHPQWEGHRVDLYLTYNANVEGRPKILLGDVETPSVRRPLQPFGVRR